MTFVAVTIAAGAHYAEARSAARRPRQPPYRLEASVVALLSGENRASQDRHSRPQVLLYVIETCRHCHAELARWAGIAHAHPGLFATADLVVITATPIRDSGSFIPPSLPHRSVVDRDRRIAAALGVRAVPFAAFVDDEGVVREIALGETDERATLGRLARLRGLHAP